MISEIEFALEDKSVECVGVGTVEWVRIPEFGFGVGVIALMILSIALANAVISLSGITVLVVSSGVSSSTGSASADPRFADIMVGVVNWVAGLEFPELSRRVKSNNPAC